MGWNQQVVRESRNISELLRIWRWSIWGSVGGILEKNPKKQLQNMGLYQFIEGNWIAGCYFEMLGNFYQ